MADWTSMTHHGREIKMGDVVAVIYEPKGDKRSQPKGVWPTAEINRLRRAIDTRISFKAAGADAFGTAGEFLADGFDPETRKCMRKMLRSRSEIAVFDGDMTYIASAAAVFAKCFGPRNVYFGVFVGKAEATPDEPFYVLKAFSTADELLEPEPVQ